MEQALRYQLQHVLSAHGGASFAIEYVEEVGGGCINTAYRISGGQQDYFVKVNERQKLANFQAECYGLRQLAAAHMRVPTPLYVGHLDGYAVCVMEYLPLGRAEGEGDWHRMGAALARVHASLPTDINARLRADGASDASLLPEVFGGTISNSTLGDRAGFLGKDDDWAAFFCRHRLQFQFEQSYRIHGFRFAQQQQVLAAARTLISHAPAASLVHGDLWGGNVAFAHFGRDGASGHGTGERVTPVFFDPAPYIADAETDLALTELFGGFPPAFYAGYDAVRPIDGGYARRRTVYNLYHVLNHYNIFGGQYRQQAQSMVANILSYASGASSP